jgi:acetyl-CoA carboxylase biotin carboxyl carrier protein
MDLETIQMLLKLMDEHDLAEVEIQSEGEVVRLRKREAQASPHVVALSPQSPPQPQPSAPTQPPPSPEAEAPPTHIEAPIVGTFYSRPNPESSPYVDVGDVVEPDSIVCIIEAMKVMNEVRAETGGRIVELLVSDGDPVEFGQPLFRIEVTS